MFSIGFKYCRRFYFYIVLSLSQRTDEMVYSDYVKQRILYYCRLGTIYGDIVDCLAKRRTQDYKGQRVQVLSMIRRNSYDFKKTRKRYSIKIGQKCQGNHRRTKDSQRQNNWSRIGNGIHVCSRTALRWRKDLGWTTKATSYCQMIRE